MNEYKAMLVELLTSKKFNALMVAVLAVLSQDPVDGFYMSKETVLELVALVVAWMFAQGKADEGKAAAKIDAEAQVKSAEALAADPPK